MDQARKNKYVLIFLLIIFALEAILFFVGNFKHQEAIKHEQEEKIRVQTLFGNVGVLAKSFSIFDATEGMKVYGRNDDEAMPLASLAKVMTVVVALNNYKEDEVLPVSQNAVNQNGDFGLFANERWKVADLAKLTLVASANDGAFAFAESIPGFLEKMNEKAKIIGAEKTVFLNFTGLDIDKVHAGAFASAEDMNTMAWFAFRDYPEIFGSTVLPELDLKSESGFKHNFKNTDTIIGKIPNLLFSKTGFTDIAGGNLTIIFKNKAGHQIVITVLGSTIDGRFSDMEKLVSIAAF